MLQGFNQVSPVLAFWLVIYAASATVAALWIIGWLWARLSRRRQITWDAHTEYLDVSEFSNRNVPLRVTYKGTEPGWLWVTYLALRNTGQLDVTSGDLPEKQHFIAGAPGCRYIGFNRLLSRKSKVTLTPLFKGEDVYCRIEFDRLGPGDEILMSLLFVADEQLRITLEGEIFGGASRLVSGYRSRLLAWRGQWWLLLTVVLVGLIGGSLFLRNSLDEGRMIQYQFQILVIIYLLALATAGVLLRPIRYWQQLPERFREAPPPGRYFLQGLKFFLSLSDEATPRD